MANIRVCFSPNISNSVHVATARTAIINYLFAKKFGGEFIIRIADLDKGRSDADVVEEILDDLRWLKLDWNEGPLCGGNYGPYKQSLRTKIYKEHINTLVDRGLLYPCYCRREYSDEKLLEATTVNGMYHYDNRCRNLTEVEKLSFENQGIKPVWRFKVEPKEILINDIIKGEIVFDTSKIGDFVVIDSDGIPVSLFTDSIDDYSMEISHVIKCGESFQTTAANILLFEAFDYPLPEFAHLGLLKGTDNKPLSKAEQNRLSICNLREKGYLPESIVNYLVNLSVPVDRSRKFLLLKELVESFNLKNAISDDMVFDNNELNTYGNYYIQDSDITRLTDLAMPYLKENNLLSGNLNEDEYQYVIDVVEVIRYNVSSLSEIPKYAAVFLKDLIQLSDVIMNELQNEESRMVLVALADLIDEEDCFDDEQSVDTLLAKIVNKTSVNMKKVYEVLKWALTGSENELQLTDILRLLNKEKIKLRIGHILNI